MSWLSKITGIHLHGKTFRGGIAGGIVEGLKSTGKILTFQHTTSKDWLKTGLLAGTVAGGYYGYTAMSAPTTGAALAPTTATALSTGAELEAAAAVGGGLGGWVEPVLAGSTSGTGGLFATVTSGLASGAETLFSGAGTALKGVAGALSLKSLFTQGSDAATNELREGVDRLIGGETSSVYAGGSGGTSPSSGGVGGFSMLPIVLILVTLTGAFLILKKKRR